jgi:type II secretory pathway component GspD/PulD (secretin)
MTFGARFAGMGGAAAGGEAKEKTAPTRAAFVADEQMNAVAASAPPDYMPMIARVVSLLDRPGEDVTEVEIFTLRHADPGEVVEEISSLFAAGTGTGSAEQPPRQMGFPFGPPGRLQPATPTATESSRLKRQAAVTAVADRRTQSVLVAASGNAMARIKRIIARLDRGNAGVMKLSVFPIESADPCIVQEGMTVLFSSASSAVQKQAQITTAEALRQQAGANSVSTTTAAASGVAVGSGGAGGLR